MADSEQDRSPAPGEPEPSRYSRFGRLGEFAARVVRPPRSSRGFVAALVVVGGLGTLVAVGGFFSQQWTETEGFCSKCHTMTPEVKAYKHSPHRDVACGECHVAPGLGGLIKAKLNGAKQTLEVLLGTYPEPIPPPNHDELPSPKETCMRCHPLSEIASEDNPTKLILKPSYREDKANTREMVALLVRPAGLSNGRGVGAHWHVQQKVEFTSPDPQSQKIDLVRVTYKNGRHAEFISRRDVTVSADARPDIKRLERTEATRPMDCITCHNRVGHEIPTPGQAVDEALTEGKISQSLPYIKREGVARIGANYKSVGAADRSIERIRGMYATKYPLVWRTRRRQVNRAVRQLKLLYELVATPEMKAIAADYPNNLGHESGPGCFRCHDGAHYEVAPDGRVTNKVIPWECTTCHTFPQIGGTVSSIAVLGAPPDHTAKLWVFNHASKVSNPSEASTNSFCANCHNSGAGKVNHEEMLFRHPAAIEKVGRQACAYCHQEAFCARCHKKPVLGSKGPFAHNKVDLLHSGVP